MSTSHQVLVLSKEASGESFLKLHLLGAELGCQLCLKHIATKNQSSKSAPDLFDTAEVQIDTSKQGTAQFIREYEITRRRSDIGLNYRSLQHASNLSRLVIHNGSHLPDLPALYRLMERSIDAFAAGSEPSLVFFKALYLLLKEEGYPVRESWWEQLPNSLRSDARTLLAQPSPQSLPSEIRAVCEASAQNLMHWLRRETDLILPSGIL